MYRMTKFFINLSEFFLNLNTFYPFYESSVPPLLKEEDMELIPPSIDCDCVEEGWKIVLELLNNEDLIWLLFISGFFATLFLWLVTTWLQRRQEKTDNRPYTRKPYKTRRSQKSRNFPPIASELKSEDEIVIKSKEDREIDCLREPVTPVNLITGDHIDGRLFSCESSQNLPRCFHPDGQLEQLTQKPSDSAEIFTKSRISDQEVSQLSPIMVSEGKKIKKEATISESKSPTRSETSSLKHRTSKSCNLRVDPIEYRKKHQKKSHWDLNVAFGSRLSSPRIGDFSCQISPAITPPMSSQARSSTNFSLISSGNRPGDEKGNLQNEKGSQNSNTSSGNSSK